MPNIIRMAVVYNSTLKLVKTPRRHLEINMKVATTVRLSEERDLKREKGEGKLEAMASTSSIG